MTADVRDRAATAGLEFIYLERAGAPAIARPDHGSLGRAAEGFESVIRSA